MYEDLRMMIYFTSICTSVSESISVPYGQEIYTTWALFCACEWKLDLLSRDIQISSHRPITCSPTSNNVSVLFPILQPHFSRSDMKAIHSHDDLIIDELLSEITAEGSGSR